MVDSIKSLPIKMYMTPEQCVLERYDQLWVVKLISTKKIQAKENCALYLLCSQHND